MTTPPAGPQEDETWWRCRCHDTVLGECPNRNKIAAALSGAAVRGGAPAALREARDVMAAYIGSRWQPPARTAAEKDLDRAERYASADTLIRALSGAGYEIRPLSENTVDSLDVERLAFLLYVRCGDRSVATAREDAEVVIRALRQPNTVPDWFAAEYRRLAATVASDASEEETNG